MILSIGLMARLLPATLRLLAVTGAAGDDAELMRAVAARDPDALAALYDRHASLVFALCLRILGQRQEAEEVLADVFWDVWQRPERYDASRGTPSGFLALLARSRATEKVRLSGRRRKIIEEGGEAEVRRTLHDERPGDPHGEASRSEMRARVGEALAALDAGQREAIELSFFEALSHREIAERLGQPLGTVKSRIRLGLVRLRDTLGAHYGVEGPA